MFKNPFKKKEDKQSSSLPWSSQANQALEMSLKQAPVPKLMKGQVEKQLKQAAEDEAIKNNHTEVTAEDLMNGLMAKLPANMQQKAKNMAANKMRGK